MQVNPHYDDVVREVREFFMERIARLNTLGFNNIILDQGFGFGKTVAHNYELMDKMESFFGFGVSFVSGNFPEIDDLAFVGDHTPKKH